MAERRSLKRGASTGRESFAVEWRTSLAIHPFGTTGHGRKSRLRLIGWNSSQNIVSSMSSKWQNFLKNLGEWRGSFTNIDGQGHVVNSIPSILNLESFEDDQLVRFRLRRFQHGNCELPPTSDTQQDYRSLGNQVVFFETGAFSKGSLQVAPFTPFGAEYGYVHADRRFRLVQLYHRGRGCRRVGVNQGVSQRQRRPGTPGLDPRTDQRPLARSRPPPSRQTGQSRSMNSPRQNSLTSTPGRVQIRLRAGRIENHTGRRDARRPHRV
jgi:hypothetical protein